VTLGFHHLSRAWYGAHCLNRREHADAYDEITIGRYDPAGGCQDELSIRFYSRPAGTDWRVEAWDDSSALLAHLSGLWSLLAERKPRTPQEVAGVIVEFGIRDLTSTERPPF
jgi:hypothetical protein